MTLFKYITGENEGHHEIQMTSPVSNKWASNVQEETCFYLAEKFQSNPPQPTNADVYLVTRPQMTVYTR